MDHTFSEDGAVERPLYNVLGYPIPDWFNTMNNELDNAFLLRDD